MTCQLCESLHEDFRLIQTTKHSFAVICKDSLKKGHLFIMPKKHVTQHEFSQLSPEETHDFFTLIEELQTKLNKYSEEDVLIVKNSGKHSTEAHFHFHLLPSKGRLREPILTYENVAPREPKPDAYYEDMKKELLAAFKEKKNS